MAKKIVAESGIAQKKYKWKEEISRENGCHYCSIRFRLSLSSFESSELKKLTSRMMCTVILILSCRRSEKSKYGCGEKSFTNWNDQKEDPNVLLLDAGDIFQGLLTLITMVENSNLN
jgi:hypothetical protein